MTWERKASRSSPLMQPQQARKATVDGERSLARDAPSPLELQRRLGNRAVQAWISETGGLPQKETQETKFGQRKTGGYERATQLRGAMSEAKSPAGLPRRLQAGLEQLSSLDLSSVRVHKNSSKPEQLNALAYTQGQDIHIAPGQEENLPHEGWHVVQQMRGSVHPTMHAKGVSINDDSNLEREADMVGKEVLQRSRNGLVAADHLFQKNTPESIHRKAANSKSKFFQQDDTTTSTRSLEMTLGHPAQEEHAVIADGDEEAVVQLRRTAYYVVRDRALSAGAGAEFVYDLPALRDHLVANVHIQEPWTLIISIHGAENILGLPPRRGLPRVQYRERDIQSIFGTVAFQDWRRVVGPTRVVLNACQVTMDFERTVINLMTRQGVAGIPGMPGQPAQGLGTGCRPDTESVTIESLTLRSQYEALPESSGRRRRFLDRLYELNNTWGYFGAPPLRGPQSAAASPLIAEELSEEVLGVGEEFRSEPSSTPPARRRSGVSLTSLLISYYFGEPPRGRWPIVRVMVPIDRVPESDRQLEEHEHPDDNSRWVTNIPFYNRAQSARFTRLCPEHVPTAQPDAAPTSHMTIRSEE